MAVFLYLGARADDDLAAAGGVGGADAAAAHDDALRGEVGALYVLHEVGQAGVRVFEHADAGVYDLDEVVWRDVGGHADGDAGGAVDEQVREARGQDLGLPAALVEVGEPVHGLLVYVTEHLVGDAGHAGLGVAVGGGGVAVHGAEVAVALDEGVAHGEVLREADEGVVDGLVAVGVVVAEHVADGGGAFFEGLVGGEPALVHGVEYAPVNRLEPVAHIRQRAPDYDAHRIVDVARLHLADDLARHDLLIGEHYVFGFVVLCHCVTTLGVVFVFKPSAWVIVYIIPNPAIVGIVAHYVVVVASLPYLHPTAAVGGALEI